MIYRLGTYIALFIEGVASAKWHRISRRTLQCLKAHNAAATVSDPHKPKRGVCLLRRLIEYSWGTDAKQLAFVLFVLLVISWFAFWPAKLPWPKIIISVLPLLPIFAILHWLFRGVQKQVEETEKDWITCREAWGASFPDPFERAGSAPSSRRSRWWNAPSS